MGNLFTTKPTISQVEYAISTVGAPTLMAALSTFVGWSSPFSDLLGFYISMICSVYFVKLFMYRTSFFYLSHQNWIMYLQLVWPWSALPPIPTTKSVFSWCSSRPSVGFRFITFLLQYLSLTLLLCGWKNYKIWIFFRNSSPGYNSVIDSDLIMVM